MGFLGALIGRIAGPNQQSIVSPLPSNDAIWSAVNESAKKLSKTAKNLEIPFTPLTGRLTLNDKEQWWCEKELERSGLSENDYPENVWPKIVKTFGIQGGLCKAAEAGCHERDYTRALNSWLKWIAMFNEAFPVEYVDKDQWLLLAKIYAGLRRTNDARKALAWAIAAADAEQTPVGRTQWLDKHMKADWKRRLDEVKRRL